MIVLIRGSYGMKKRGGRRKKKKTQKTLFACLMACVMTRDYSGNQSGLFLSSTLQMRGTIFESLQVARRRWISEMRIVWALMIY